MRASTAREYLAGKLDALNALAKSDSEAMQKSLWTMMGKHSKEPEERKKWIIWLAAMVAALTAQPVLERVREVALSAHRDGVDWRALYEAAQSGRPSWWSPVPPEDLVNPEK